MNQFFSAPNDNLRKGDVASFVYGDEGWVVTFTRNDVPMRLSDGRLTVSFGNIEDHAKKLIFHLIARAAGLLIREVNAYRYIFE